MPKAASGPRIGIGHRDRRPETTTARQLMPPGRSHFRKSLPGSAGSAAQSQTGDQILVGLLVAGLDVVQKIAALADHRQQAPARTEILLVCLQMLGQVHDPLGQDGHLNGVQQHSRTDDCGKVAGSDAHSPARYFCSKL